MKYNTRKLLDNAVFEVLETRQMMSVSPASTISLSNGVLTIQDNSTKASSVVVDLADKNTLLTVDLDGLHASNPIGQVKQINITGGGEADYIYINPAIDIPSSISSGDGNDVIRAGASNNTIIVGNGNDMIYGRGGNDVILAGNGNDTIRTGTGKNTVTVGNGNDSIVSGGGADKITAGSGNDTFLAGTSHDTITTGTGHDVMIGGLGNTYLYGKNTASSTSSVSTGSTTNSGATTTTTSGAKTSTGSTSTSGSTAGGSSTATTTSTSGSSSTGTPTTGTKTTGGATTQPALPTQPASPIIADESALIGKGAAPVAIINTMAGPRVTGIVVNVDGLQSKLGTGTAITTNYAWDFGDPNGADNHTTGYNGAHVYDTPGTYTITLTVTDEDGQVSQAAQIVTIAASTRAQIYVNPTTGSDSNNGSENAPLKSLPAAFNKLTANCEILLAAGQTFYTGASLHINVGNVLIGRYGTGANPMIIRSVGNGVSTIASYGGANGLTIQDITFNSPYDSTDPSSPKIGVSGIYLGGENCTVRDCTFMNLDDAVNENDNPTGTLIQNNTAPLATGLRGYFVWGQGAQQVIIGNTVAGSTHEHNIRLVGLDEVTVEDNTLTNHDGKGCIEMHEGEYGWIEDNSTTGGDIRLGPLGLWGEAASSQTDNCVIEDNQLTDTFINIVSGTHNAMIVNNVINNTAGAAITIDGPDSQGRTSQGIIILNNTATDSGSSGNFINVWGYVNGIVMQDNLFVAPKLQGASGGSTPVAVQDSNLDDFTLISGNVWPAVDTTGTFAKGGINWVGLTTTGTSFLTDTQWNNMPQVKGDTFENITLNGSYELKIDSVVVGSSLKLAA
jgi:hypothetical protein